LIFIRPEDPEVNVFFIRASTKKGCRFVIKKATLTKEEWLRLRTKTLAPVLSAEELDQLVNGKSEDDSEHMQILRQEFMKGTLFVLGRIIINSLTFVPVLGAAVMALDDGETRPVFKDRVQYHEDLACELGAESFILEDTSRRGSLLNLLVSVGKLQQAVETCN
jgi:hypothetical protein